MPQIHPTTLIEGDVDLADDVVVGPGCNITGPVTIGPGCRLLGNVWLQGPLRMGGGNVIYPFTCLGLAPQAHSFDPARPGHGLEIGDHNTFRESVTVHRAMTDAGPTRIGSHNYLMVNCHAGHDTRIGNSITITNAAQLGGHVTIDDNAMIGGNAGVHQFVRVGRGAMLAGTARVTQDVPPFFLVSAFNFCASVNLVGLRRRGATQEDIATIKWVYKTLYRRGLAYKTAVNELRGRAEDPIVAGYLEFLGASSRGICPGPDQGRRRRPAAVIKV